MASLPWLSRFADVDVEWTWVPPKSDQLLAVWSTPLLASQESPLLLKAHDLSLFVEDGVKLLPRKWTWAIWPTSVFAACQISKSWHEANDKRYTLLPTCTFQTWSWYKVDGTTLDVPSFPQLTGDPGGGPEGSSTWFFVTFSSTTLEVERCCRIWSSCWHLHFQLGHLNHHFRIRFCFPHRFGNRGNHQSWDNWKIVEAGGFWSRLPLLPHRWRYCDNASWSCRSGLHYELNGRVDQTVCCRWQFFLDAPVRRSDGRRRIDPPKLLRLRKDKWHKKFCQHMINKKCGVASFCL